MGLMFSPGCPCCGCLVFDQPGLMPNYLMVEIHSDKLPAVISTVLYPTPIGGTNYCYRPSDWKPPTERRKCAEETYIHWPEAEGGCAYDHWCCMTEAAFMPPCYGSVEMIEPHHYILTRLAPVRRHCYDGTTKIYWTYELRPGWYYQDIEQCYGDLGWDVNTGTSVTQLESWNQKIAVSDIAPCTFSVQHTSQLGSCYIKLIGGD